MLCSRDMDAFWRSRIDRVTVIRHTAYARSRGALLERELRRVGLDGFAESRWTFPSPFVAALGRAVRLDPSITCGGNVDAMVFGFYAEMKTALALGAANVLILEDDVRFANDIDMIRGAIDALPSDFHEAHLSWLAHPLGRCEGTVSALPCVGGSWVVAGDRVRVRDSSATIYSRAGMERFVSIAESALDDPAGRGLVACDVTDYPDLLWDGGSHTLLALPLLARQTIVGACMSAGKFVPFYKPFCLNGDVTAFGGGCAG